MKFLKSSVMLCLLIYSDFILILRCRENGVLQCVFCPSVLSKKQTIAIQRGQTNTTLMTIGGTRKYIQSLKSSLPS